MERLGLGKPGSVSMYDNSLSEWASLAKAADMPMVTGLEPAGECARL